MKKKIQKLLEQKERQLAEINYWFEKEYNNNTSDDTLDDWQKNGAEVSAQIKILRFLLDEK